MKFRWITMSFLDKIKSVFVVTDPQASPNSAKDNSMSDASKPTNASVSVSEHVSYQGQASEKFLEILSQVLEKNNQPGFDYLEYKKAVLSVAKLQNLDEAGQFRTAYAAAQAMGVQPSALLDSARKYLSILSVEEQNFTQSANQFLSKQVSSKETESGQLRQSMQQKEQQIQQLQKELDLHKKRFSELEAELKQAKEKVDSNKANFKASYQQIVDQIATDIQKMEQYLK